MKQNPTTAETKSPVETQPPPKPASLMEVPLWLVTSFVFAVISLVSLAYYFLVKRMKSTRRYEDFETPHPSETKPAVVIEHEGLEIVKKSSVFALTTAVEGKTVPQSSANQDPAPSGEWNREQLKLIVGSLLGLAIAYFAQGIIDSTISVGILRNWEWFVFQPEANRLWLGAGLYLIAVLIWIFTAPAMSSVTPAMDPPAAASEKTGLFSLRPFLLISAILVYLAAVVTFQVSGENAFVRIMWGVGVVFFVLSQIPGKIWHPQAESSPRFTWKNWLILGGILLAGFWLRYYQVATIPDDLHGDMASHGQVARDFLLGRQHDIFGFGWTATPTIGFLPAFLTMAVFGDNIFGLQMAAVIGGTFSLFAIYLLTWRWFDSHRLAALTTALVAINVVHIHFSRIFNMEPWPLSNLAIFLLVDGFRSRRSASFGLAGVCIGFSLLMYTSGRALPFMLIAFVLYALLFKRAWISQNLRGFVLLVVGVVVAMGPALVYYLSVWDSYIQRSREVFLFSQGVMDHLLSKYNTDSVLTVVLTQIKLSLLMFNQASDTSSQFSYPHPMFNSLVSPLILLGFGYALRRWKNAGMAFVLIWLSVVMVLGSILTIDAPFWPRLVGILPVAALLIAFVLDQIIELGRKIFGSQGTALTSVLIIAFLVMVGSLNWIDYYAFVKHSGSPSTVTGRYIGSLSGDFTACGIISGPQLTVRETAFLAWPHDKLVDIAPDSPDSELDKCTGSALVWVLSPENVERLDAIRARWSDGVVQEIYLAKFDYTLTFYLVGVQPPKPQQPDQMSRLSPGLVNGISIIGSLLLSAMLVWLFFRGTLQEAWREWRTKLKIEAVAAPVVGNSLIETPAPEIKLPKPGQPALSNFNSLKRWYNEIATFEPSKVDLKLLASILLPLLAVGLAYFAQTFLDQVSSEGLHLSAKWLVLTSDEERLGVASLIFLAAALIWTFATASGTTLSSFKFGTAAQSGNVLQPMAGSPLQMIGVFFTVGAMLLYVVMDETSLVRWFWLAGLILFAASLFIKKPSRSPMSGDESPAFRWFHMAFLTSLLVLTFLLRIHRLYDIPLDLSTDMASVGINARDYLLGFEKRIFGTGWYFMPRITFIPYMFGMAVAGNNLVGLYSATVVMGTLNVLGTYLFVWRLFDRHRLALLTAVLVAINPAHINLSRITSYVDPWFLGFFALFFFVDGLKGRRWVSLAVAGVFIGFTLVSYPSGRAIIPLILIGLACFWLFNRKWVTDNYGGLGWMTLGMLVALGPNLIYFMTDWSVYMQRSGQVLIFNPGNVAHLKNTYETDSMWVVVLEQVKLSVFQFNYFSDKSAQFSYPHPMFNSLISPFLFLGFGMSLYRWRKPEFLFSLLSFLFILVTGCVLTIDAPTWVRVVGVIPLAALFIALVIDEFVNILERASLKPFVPVLMVGVALFLFQLGAMDWKIYLRDVGNEDMTRPEVHVARYLDSLPDEVTACGITDDYRIDQEEIVFMGWPRLIVVVPAETVILSHELCPGDNLVWILAPAYRERLVELKVKWPGGTTEDHITKNGWLVFTSYLVTDKTP